MNFPPLQSFFKNTGLHWDLKSQTRSSFENEGVHSLTFFYIPRTMKCDSWASLLTCTFANLYLGHKPKAKVVTYTMWSMYICIHTLYMCVNI